MYSDLLIFFVVASVPALTSVLKEEVDYCSGDEFSCGDGTCISYSMFCDGKNDCLNGEDEACEVGTNALSTNTILNRSRRQLSTCRLSQWQCRDGSCISFDGKCDGVVDCPDGSDETHALCRERQCQYNWFRCTYGACVDGTAPCNGIQECADNSDELLPRCRNETEEIRGQFRCLDGRMITADKHCDGIRDCADGSDETLRTCAGKMCLSYLFQCAYGACVDQGADCNGIRECADGSDENDVLCENRNGIEPTRPTSSGACVLPEFPAHGSYVVSGVRNAKPGDSFDAVQLNYTCHQGYGILGRSDIVCTNGWWSEKAHPRCIRFCRLKKHPSVEYKCVLSGDSQGFRTCNEYEPVGIKVQPECSRPNYYSDKELQYMTCFDNGDWSSSPECTPECGTVTPEGTELVLGGKRAKRGELPWHAGIYSKNTRPYMQICGGSLISRTVVLTAAHCFWANDTIQPKEEYAVALGKLYRPWSNKYDDKAQTSEIRAIHTISTFLGATGNFQSDIAVVILETPIVYMPHIRPVCLNFQSRLEQLQLREGSLGKVAGWGIKDEAGNPSQVLKVVEIPFVDLPNCITRSPVAFRPYITGDKICAGYANGTGLCKGDSGGGLSFEYDDTLVKRYYLRGIVSTAHTSNDACNAFALTTFTNIMIHEPFIKQYWSLD